MTKGALDAIDTSTTLEPNKSLCQIGNGHTTEAYRRLQAESVLTLTPLRAAEEPQIFRRG